jgi:hypothetical protein
MASIIILGFSRFIVSIVVVLLLFIGCRVVVFWAYTIDIATIDATTILTIYQFDIIPQAISFSRKLNLAIYFRCQRLKIQYQHCQMTTMSVPTIEIIFFTVYLGITNKITHNTILD